ncbi:MAG: YcxB family protein [Clostridiales bacterium]
MEQKTMNVEKTVVVNTKDRRNAMIYNIFFRRKWVTCYVGIFILFSIAVLITGFTHILPIPKLLMLMAGAFLFLLIGFIITIFVSSKGDSRERELVFDNQGLTTFATYNSKEVSYKWKDLFFTGKTKNYFYFYLDAAQFIIVPKRYFDQDEIEAISRYI